ncbi:hypothetical protein Cgig2_012294 [Carnegiea gigantea]|uniref:Uncharacterized protein n=1 Tax=Carnegiea gigantea TaxID=171969 RepID=A0A9Q1GLE1_9CARY|nr:hypothetical protein Cgig2_012294 [Carnegiea gigantea]
MAKKSRVRCQLIYERLDGAIGRQDWYTLYPTSLLIHGPFTCSDHCFILLDTQGSAPRQKQPPFQFQLDWIQHEQVNNMISQQWQCTIRGSLMFRIAHQLKSIKTKLKYWKSTTGTNYKRQIDKNTEKIHYVENRLIDNADSPRFNHWHQRLVKGKN